VVLCIGESMTALGGEHSFPMELQRILDNSSEKKFKVINKGIPGTGSDKIVNTHLNGWLNTYDPDIVVSMMGINDGFYYAPVNTSGQNIILFLKNLRVYKLISLIKEHIKSRFGMQWFAKASDLSGLQSENIPKTLKKALPEKVKKFYNTAVYLQGIHEYEKAEKLFRILATADLDGELKSKIYYNLGICLKQQKKYREFAGILDRIPYYSWEDMDWLHALCSEEEGFTLVRNKIENIMKNNPKNSCLYNILAACYSDHGDTKSADEYNETAKNFLSRNINTATQKNYLTLNKLLKEKNIRGIFVQYPIRELSSLKNMFPPGTELKHITFVENEENFKDALSKTDYDDLFTDRFAGDFGHCTEKRNKIIAQSIANAVLK